MEPIMQSRIQWSHKDELAEPLSPLPLPVLPAKSSLFHLKLKLCQKSSSLSQSESRTLGWTRCVNGWPSPLQSVKDSILSAMVDESTETHRQKALFSNKLFAGWTIARCTARCTWQLITLLTTLDQSYCCFVSMQQSTMSWTHFNCFSASNDEDLCAGLETMPQCTHWSSLRMQAGGGKDAQYYGRWSIAICLAMILNSSLTLYNKATRDKTS
jgi:hypothetical protein